jgi:hypothetical protein
MAVACTVTVHFNLEFQKRWEPDIPLYGTRQANAPLDMIFLTTNFIHILTLQTSVFKLEGCMDQKLRKDRCARKKILVTIQE